MAGPSPKGVAEHHEGHEDVAGGGHEGDERESRRRAAEEKDQTGGLTETLSLDISVVGYSVFQPVSR